MFFIGCYIWKQVKLATTSENLFKIIICRFKDGELNYLEFCAI